MKEYNREKRIWETPKPEGSLKKRKLCRGNRPHDFKLSLPSYIQHQGELSPETIEEYYATEERVNIYVATETKHLENLGIKRGFGYRGKVTRHYKCEVCGKQEYDI